MRESRADLSAARSILSRSQRAEEELLTFSQSKRDDDHGHPGGESTSSTKNTSKSPPRSGEDEPFRPVNNSSNTRRHLDETKKGAGDYRQGGGHGRPAAVIVSLSGGNHLGEASKGVAAAHIAPGSGDNGISSYSKALSTPISFITADTAAVDDGAGLGSRRGGEGDAVPRIGLGEASRALQGEVAGVREVRDNRIGVLERRVDIITWHKVWSTYNSR